MLIRSFRELPGYVIKPAQR